jgi:hypothetical protein
MAHLYKGRCYVCGREVLTTDEGDSSRHVYDVAGCPLLACPDCGLSFGHIRLLHPGEQCVLKNDPGGRLVQHACGEVLLARDWDSFFWRRDGEGPVFLFCPKCDKYISFLEKPLFPETAIRPYHEGKPKPEDKAPTAGHDADRGEGFLSALRRALQDDGPQDPEVRAAYANRRPAPVQDDGTPALDLDVWGSLFDPNGPTVPEPAPVKRKPRQSKKGGQSGTDKPS